MSDVNDFDGAVKQALEDFKGVQGNFQKLLSEYRRGWRGACSRAREFDDAIVERDLKKSEMLLQKDGYQVSLLGTFSAGKSILANGLLEAPGFLPSSQGVCTLCVTEVMGSHGMQGEGIVVRYMTMEGAFRKVFGSDQFRDQLAHRMKDLSPFDEKEAKRYVEEAIEAYDQSDEPTIQENAGRLKGFLKALDEFRGRLASTHTDSIANKDDYLSAQGKAGDVRGGLGEGHMWLIERAFVTIENQVLARENVKMVDLPGVDAPSAHDKEVTFGALPDSDAAILVVGDRGFAQADKELIERIGALADSVKDKIFVVVNKMDNLHMEQITKFEKEFWPDLQAKVHQMGLSLSKLYFTSAYVEERSMRERLSMLNEQDAGDFAAMRSNLAEKLKAVQKIQDESVRERLAPVFIDGGVRKLRQDLYTYLRHDIKRERLKEVYAALRHAHGKWDWLLEPERGRIETGDRLRRERVSQYFREQVDALGDVVAKFKTGKAAIQESLVDDAPVGDGGQGGLSYGIQNLVLRFVKQPAPGAVKDIIDHQLSFDRVRSRVSVHLPVNIRQEALKDLKPLIKEKFNELVMANIPNALVTKFEKMLSPLELQNTFEYFAREFREPFAETYAHELDYFKRTVKLVSELRIKEILRPIDEIQVGAMPGEPPQWNDRLETQFKDMLKSKFAELMGIFADQLVVLADYYKALLDVFEREYRKLMDQILKYVAERRAWNVDLPSASRRGDGMMDEKEILQSIADTTDMAGNKLDAFRTSLAPTLGLQA